MITLIIVLCIVISVAIICYTYYKVRELNEYLIDDNNCNETTINFISRFINKYSETINNKTLNPTGFIRVDSINIFLESIKVIINKNIEDYDEY